MRMTEKTKRTKRHRFESDSRNHQVRSDLQSCDSFLQSTDRDAASLLKQTAMSCRKAFKQLRKTDREVNKSFVTQLSFQNYQDNYKVAFNP